MMIIFIADVMKLISFVAIKDRNSDYDSVNIEKKNKKNICDAVFLSSSFAGICEDYCELRRIRWKRLRYRHLGIALINFQHAIRKNAPTRGGAFYLSGMCPLYAACLLERSSHDSSPRRRD